MGTLDVVGFLFKQCRQKLINSNLESQEKQEKEYTAFATSWLLDYRMTISFRYNRVQIELFPAHSNKMIASCIIDGESRSVYPDVDTHNLEQKAREILLLIQLGTLKTLVPSSFGMKFDTRLLKTPPIPKYDTMLISTSMNGKNTDTSLKELTKKHIGG